MSTLQAWLNDPTTAPALPERRLSRNWGRAGLSYRGASVGAGGALAPPPRVAAPVKEGWHVFDARLIAQFRADAKYTVFTVEAREYVISEPLQALEERLRAHGFMRVHRGALVNLFMVRAVRRQGRQTLLELTGQPTAVNVSRRHTAKVCRALGIGNSDNAVIREKSVLRVAS